MSNIHVSVCVRACGCICACVCVYTHVPSPPKSQVVRERSLSKLKREKLALSNIGMGEVRGGGVGVGGVEGECRNMDQSCLRPLASSSSSVWQARAKTGTGPGFAGWSASIENMFRKPSRSISARARLGEEAARDVLSSHGTLLLRSSKRRGSIKEEEDMIEETHQGRGERAGATEEDDAERRGGDGGRKGEGDGGDGRREAVQFSTDQRELSRRAQERRRQLEEERQRLCPFKPYISPARSIPKP